MAIRLCCLNNHAPAGYASTQYLDPKLNGLDWKAELQVRMSFRSKIYELQKSLIALITPEGVCSARNSDLPLLHMPEVIFMLHFLIGLKVCGD